MDGFPEVSFARRFRNLEGIARIVPGVWVLSLPTYFNCCPFPLKTPNCWYTSRNPSVQAEAVDTIYPAHTNALREAGLAPPVFPTMEELWKKQDEKVEKNKERDVSVKKKQKFLFLCCLLTLFFYSNPQGD